MPHPSTISTTRPVNVLDLENATTIIVREVGERLYLDAYNLANGASLSLALNEADESVLRAILDARRERRAAFGSAVRP